MKLDPQVFTSVITLIGVLAVAIFTLYQNAKTNNILKKGKYVDVVTSQRIKWIEDVRESASKLIIQLHYYQRTFLSAKDTEKRTELIDATLFLIVKFSLLLNPKEDKRLIKLLNKMRNSFNFDQNEALRHLRSVEKIRIRTQEILKKEWEKVKVESIL